MELLSIFHRNIIYWIILHGKLILLTTRMKCGVCILSPKKIIKELWNKMRNKTLKSNLRHGATAAQIDELVDNYEGFGF